MRRFAFRVASGDSTDSVQRIRAHTFNFDGRTSLITSLLRSRDTHPTLSLLTQCRNGTIKRVLFAQTAFGKRVSSPLVRVLTPLTIVPRCRKVNIKKQLVHANVRRLELVNYRAIFILNRTACCPQRKFRPYTKSGNCPTPCPVPRRRGTY